MPSCSSTEERFRGGRRSRQRRDATASAATSGGGGGGGGNKDELTALKALDIMLRKYDRRSTPTNDQGEHNADVRVTHLLGKNLPLT